MARHKRDGEYEKITVSIRKELKQFLEDHAREIQKNVPGHPAIYLIDTLEYVLAFYQRHSDVIDIWSSIYYYGKKGCHVEAINQKYPEKISPGAPEESQTQAC